MEAKTQKIQSGNSWVQEDGSYVDKKRLFPYEIKSERAAVRLFNQAIKIQDFLAALVADAEKSVAEVQASYLKAKSPEKLKEETLIEKGFTFYSFNRGIKIEKIIQPITGYKEEDIALSKEHFEQYITNFEGPEEKIQILKKLVMSAFTTKSGKFDYKKLDALLGYKDEIQDEIFQKAIKLLEEARYNKKVKAYYNIYFRNEEGVYQQVNLRISGAN